MDFWGLAQLIAQRLFECSMESLEDDKYRKVCDLAREIVGGMFPFCVCQGDWTDGTTHCQQCGKERRQ